MERSTLFAYLVINLHNSTFFKSLSSKDTSNRLISIGSYSSFLQKVEYGVYIEEPYKINDFTRKALYFFDFTGFDKELQLFDPRGGNKLYSTQLDLILMGYSKCRLKDIFTAEYSYADLFSEVAILYSRHQRRNLLARESELTNLKEKGVLFTRVNKGYTNYQLGLFSEKILSQIEVDFQIEKHEFTGLMEIYEYYKEAFINDPTILKELDIAKYIIENKLIDINSLESFMQNGFEFDNTAYGMMVELIKAKGYKFLF